ncbi:MAG TPA: hypothetical protein VGX03_32660 [Candidatus Binatia bacterium]|jgi:hypothetical protein|nr:hypothetical protein [Candidatus Binatia bacterium]
MSRLTPHAYGLAATGQVAEVAGGAELELAVAAAGQERRGSQDVGRDYSWFTEGFDTADLKEARMLLEELQ